MLSVYIYRCISCSLCRLTHGAVCDCLTHCLQPFSWCMPFNATLLFSTVKQCQLTKLLCTEMWFLNMKQKQNKTKQNQKRPAPEHFSKCLDSRVHGKAIAANFSSFKPLEMVFSLHNRQATDVFIGPGQFQDAGFQSKRVSARSGRLGWWSKPYLQGYVICKSKGGKESKRKWGEDPAKISKGIWKNEDH